MVLNEKVVLVTGASSGIGAAVVRAAADAGARVVMIARRAGRLDALANDLPDALPIKADVTRRAEVDAAVAAAVDHYGRVDVLINNAGQGLHLPLEEVDLDDLRAILELNVVAALGVMQAVMPVMREQGEGAIVNVSSGSALMVPPGVGAYAATKSALDKLTAVARLEWAEAGVVVSNIHPFVTKTEFHDTLRAGRLQVGADRADSAERVADEILELVRTGAEDISLVPADFF